MDLQLGSDLTQIRQLAITQQTVKALEILAMGNWELAAYLEQQALENPTIEINNEPSQDQSEAERDRQLERLEWLTANDYGEREVLTGSESTVNLIETIAVDNVVTLTDYLWEQLNVMKLEVEERSIARQIIEHLDDNGYLETDIPELSIQMNIPAARIEEILRVVQTLEPFGVAARNLQECLLIQLDNLGYRDRAFKLLITDCFDDLAQNRLNRIVDKTGLSIPEVKRYWSMIKRLNPYPGRAFGGFDKTPYIRPDILIVSMDGRFEPILNEAVYPTLSLNNYYLTLLKRTEDSQVKQYLLGRVKDAVWLRKTVHRRMDTLFKVAQTIVQIQQQFFAKGPKYLVSMNLSDIAQKLSLHESTVSRAVHDKYLECSKGVYQLKYFFSSKADSERSGRSRQAIKAEIIEIIRSEDKSRPYSDSQLVELLGQRQIAIARRTVAKYREELGIAGASLRKRLS